MNTSERASALNYGAALACIAAALLMRWLLDPVLEDTLPLTTLYGAIGIAAWIGGYRPALLVVVLGYLACAYLFIQPRGQLGLSDARNLIGLLLFLGTAAVIIGLGEALRRALQRYRMGEGEARQQAERMHTTLASIDDGVIATDPDGRVTSINAEHRDARQQLATTLESITDGFMRYDRDWRIVYVNAEAEKINNLTRSEMLGKSLWSLFPALVGTKFESEYRRAVADQVTIEFENYYEPFGRWYSLKGYPTADGGLTTYIRDITEQKQFEQQLVQSEARYRAIGESIDYGVWECDATGRNTYASESFLQLVGITQQQCSDFGWGDVLHPEDAEATIAAWNECVRTQGRWDRVHRFKGVDGQWHHVLARGVPLRNAAGQNLGWSGLNLDIGRLIQAEQEIVRMAAESERQRRLYETVLTNTPDFVYVFSLDHKVLYANDALIKMWGRGSEGAIGKTFLEIGYEPWHAEMHDREIDQVRATGRPIRGEVPFSGTSGRRHYDYIFVPVFGAHGEVEAVAGTTRDVTERREAEERLRASQERQSYLVRLADTLRPLSDPREVQAQASRVLGEHLGANRVVYFEVQGDDYVVERDYTDAAASVVGRHHIASFGPEQRSLYEAGCTAAEADVDALPSRTPGEKEAFAAVQIRSYVGVPLVKGGALVAGLAVHVTKVREWSGTEIAIIEDTAERTWAAVERVRAEARLRESEERRRLALDAAEMGAWHIDPVSKTLTTDDRFRSIFAGTTEAMDSEQAFACVHADDRGRVRDAVAAATRADDPAPYAEEYRVIHKDGSVRWVFARGRANFDRSDPRRLVSFDGTVADVTERKCIEDERERLVGQLRDADRRKDEFLATLAHELRNPLAPIRNALHIMRLSGDSGTIEKARAVMERQLLQLVRLVDDLLDMSRITSGKLELRREPVELRQVIDAAVETSLPAIEQEGHALNVFMPDEPVIVEGDAIRLAQVVSNLLNNSAKYTKVKGDIRLNVRREDGMAVVMVADDGIGIPPAMIDRVFDMFTQVDRTLEKTTGGLGIGLSLVKGLVGMHGGTIEARSEGEGLGSEFIVRLPEVLSTVRKVESTIVDEAPGPSSRRSVLIADDNADSAESLKQVLELLGHDVRIADNGVHAVDLAQVFRPDVILLDIAMPKLNGFEACRRIRGQPWGKNAILVAITGWGHDEDRRRSREAGFDHHLVKPVDIERLEKLLAVLRPEESSH